ncbi:AraC family transcriptional regulator [Chitinophaga sp. CC14]|uniref:helix-turn-helix domain-containing protein n=1 Tax=Chitinophaga sp. CC14 TaxID=3029199 RepID=UPI003B80311F
MLRQLESDIRLLDALLYSSNDSYTMNFSNQQAAAIQYAKKLIECSPFRRYRIKELSRLTGISNTVLTSGFLHFYQITIGKYHLYTSMEYAKALLEGGMPMKEVFMLFDYQSLANFNRAFKKVFGNLPSAYRLRK